MQIVDSILVFIDGRRVQILESVFIIRNIGVDNVWHSWGLAFSD